MGGALNCAELLKISRLLYVSRRMKSYLSDFNTGSVLKEAAESIITAKQTEDKINSCILSEEEIADDASAELAAPSASITSTRARYGALMISPPHPPAYRAASGIDA